MRYIFIGNKNDSSYKLLLEDYKAMITDLTSKNDPKIDGSIKVASLSNCLVTNEGLNDAISRNNLKSSDLVSITKSNKSCDRDVITKLVATYNLTTIYNELISECKVEDHIVAYFNTNIDESTKNDISPKSIEYKFDYLTAFMLGVGLTMHIGGSDEVNDLNEFKKFFTLVGAIDEVAVVRSAVNDVIRMYGQIENFYDSSSGTTSTRTPARLDSRNRVLTMGGRSIVGASEKFNYVKIKLDHLNCTTVGHKKFNYKEIYTFLKSRYRSIITAGLLYGSGIPFELEGLYSSDFENIDHTILMAALKAH